MHWYQWTSKLRYAYIDCGWLFSHIKLTSLDLAKILVLNPTYSLIKATVHYYGNTFLLSFLNRHGVVVWLCCNVLGCFSVTISFFISRYVKSDQAVIVVHICVCLSIAMLLFMFGVEQTKYKVSSFVFVFNINIIQLQYNCHLTWTQLPVPLTITHKWFSQKYIVWISHFRMKNNCCFGWQYFILTLLGCVYVHCCGPPLLLHGELLHDAGFRSRGTVVNCGRVHSQI